MNEISISGLAADCVRTVEQVARTGEPVTIVRDGKAIARLVPVQITQEERRAIEAAASTLDLDDDVIDAEEIAAMEETNLQWNALNAAIDRDLGAASHGESSTRKTSGKGTRKAAEKSRPKAPKARAKPSSKRR